MKKIKDIALVIAAVGGVFILNVLLWTFQVALFLAALYFVLRLAGCT